MMVDFGESQPKDDKFRNNEKTNLKVNFAIYFILFYAILLTGVAADVCFEF